MIKLLHDSVKIELNNNIFGIDDFTKSFSYFDRLISNASFKKLFLIECDNSFESLSLYLWCLERQNTAILLPKNTKESIIQEISDQYKPNCMYLNNELKIIHNKNLHLHKNLALLLTTSGSTGVQKCVRLSYENISSNMQSIAEYLKLNKNTNCLINLPLSYSFGLSILHSHLYKRSSVIISDIGPLEKGFYDFLKDKKVSSIYGVPFTFEMLLRTGLQSHNLPDLKFFAQAGGHLVEKYKRLVLNYCEKNKVDFYVMYGQTEASPRISYVPPKMLYKKIDSIGVPIPGGKIDVDEKNSELIYTGKNVMMGYAESYEDLSKGNLLNNILRTGDVGEIDPDGYFYIRGRIKRLIKISGIRFSLDSIEQKIQSTLGTRVACIGTDDKLKVIFDNADKNDAIRSMLVNDFKINNTKFKVIFVEEIKLNSNKKIDYNALKELYG